jgi:hypothetical protein
MGRRSISRSRSYTVEYRRWFRNRWLAWELTWHRGCKEWPGFSWASIMWKAPTLETSSSPRPLPPVLEKPFRYFTYTSFLWSNVEINDEVINGWCRCGMCESGNYRILQTQSPPNHWCHRQGLLSYATCLCLTMLKKPWKISEARQNYEPFSAFFSFATHSLCNCTNFILWFSISYCMVRKF